MTPEEIAALEQAWIGRVPPDEPGRYFGWEPAPVGLFTSLLAACLPHVPPGNRTFLGVGCGIGTKALLAAQAGLTAYGLDRVPEYVEQARALGVVTSLGLAEDYDGYGRFGLVYVNHPLNCGPGCDDEAALEHAIHEQMAPRSVYAGMNYDLAPGCRAHPPGRACDDACPVDTYDGWTEVARLGAWNAAWVKR